MQGRGEVRVAAYGVGDAEHLVEKELRGLWPAATVRIERVARFGPARIVEEFEVTYRMEGTLLVEAETEGQALSTALRRLAALLAGSRYSRTGWEHLAREPGS